MKKWILSFAGILLVVTLLTANYNNIDDAVTGFVSHGQTQRVFVSRVIDGDTIVVSDSGEGEHIRLLGINTPERGELFYSEAKEFLEDLVLNETVILEFVGPREDKYGRTLAYVSFGGENVNVKIVEEGFGNYYFYDGRDKYSSALENAWNSCLEKEVNLCEKSKDVCSSCVIISGSSIVNTCSMVCDISGWEIKGEGRSKFVFDGSLRSGESKGWDVGLEGTLFLRDDEGGLVDYLS